MNTKNVVVAVCIHASSVLMGKRTPKEKRFAGYWEFPGGKIEEGESDKEALAREIQEELGCQMLSAKYVRAITWQYPDAEIFLKFFSVKLSSHKIEDMELNAHCELKWVSLDKLSSVETFPANKEVIAEITSFSGHF